MSELANRVAIIGMACRLPNGNTVEEFWDNLVHGAEGITFYSRQELLDSGIAASVVDSEFYVRAKGELHGIDRFDAEFFGFSPREARLMDPQHRLLLECSWEALERAGYDPRRFPGAIGMYAGVGPNTYLFNLYQNAEVLQNLDSLEIAIANEKDFCATRVSYCLGLTGPSVCVQSACSTSLVATHLACQSLLNGECDMALAGGAAVTLPQKSGYFYREQGVLSPDGHCRAFDAAANGTVPGNGVAVITLKRLEDAVRDRDHIYAQIRSSAVNNDGVVKVGFTAPSVDGHAKVVRMAHALGEVGAGDIGYIEAHGTGTAMGDPIEIAGLTKAFAGSTSNKNYCAIGSLKTNLGHLDSAAGIAGLMKAVLVVNHGIIPASLHFKQANAKIDFKNSPFYVASSTSAFPVLPGPRLAGVSSLGIGGTNAHVVVEQPPAIEGEASNRAYQLLTISARTPDALEQASSRLSTQLQKHTELQLADVAYTLQKGRRDFSHRRAVVAQSTQDASDQLSSGGARTTAEFKEDAPPRIIFLFPGSGSQFVGMGEELYRSEPVFREELTRCAQILAPVLKSPLSSILFPTDAAAGAADSSLSRSETLLPALFSLEYSLAKLLMSWGIRPAAMIGHSVGEYVAACMAGVFRLEEALPLLVRRGQLLRTLPPGAMVSVMLTEGDLRPWLSESLSIAASNAPEVSMVAGPADKVDELCVKLTEAEIEWLPIDVDVASHCAMVEPIAPAFTALVGKMNLQPPQIPLVSNVTGEWMRSDEAVDPGYWGSHLCKTVRFSASIRTASVGARDVFVEVGPGRALSTLVGSQLGTQQVIQTLRSNTRGTSDGLMLANALGKLWLAGAEINWDGYYRNERRRRVPLPGYPFQRQRYWVEPTAVATPQPSRPEARRDIAECFYVPSWKLSAPVTTPLQEPQTYLLFADALGVARILKKKLQLQGNDIIIVSEGKQFARQNNNFQIDPKELADYDRLFATLAAEGRNPQRIVHCWGLSGRIDEVDQEREQLLNFTSLVLMGKALTSAGSCNEIRLEVIANYGVSVFGDETVIAERALAFGVARVLPHELPNLTCRVVGVDFEPGADFSDVSADILHEIQRIPESPVVAYRKRHRWVQCFEQVRFAPAAAVPGTRAGGVYVVIGGLGGIGLCLAESLSRTPGVKLALLGRSEFPAPGTWDAWLHSHPKSDPVSAKIARLVSLNANGATVQVYRCSVCDENALGETIAQIETTLGNIHGVIHAAGMEGGGAIAVKREEEMAAVLAPKVQGARNLARIFHEKPLDFFVLCSSLNSYLGRFGLTDYCASNAYLDALAQTMRDEPHKIIRSIAWDRWRGTGMSVSMEDLHQKVTGQRPAGGLDAGVGIEAFERILFSSATPQVIVSTYDFETLVQECLPKHGPKADWAVQVTLPQARHQRPSLASEYLAPRNAREETIAGIWTELLGIEGIGVHDQFSDLGGQSLLATRVLARMREALHVSVNLRMFFEHPTIAALAQVTLTATVAADDKIAPCDRSLPIPLSFAQRRLWFIDQLAGSSGTYNIPVHARLRTKLDQHALTRALVEIVRRHEALRTAFHDHDGVPWQVVQCVDTDARVPTVDLSGLSSRCREEEWKRVARQETQRSFDLAAGRLFRPLLLRLSANDHLLLLTIHHIAIDGWSIGILSRELKALYDAYRSGLSSPLAEPQLQYADFAVWQRARLQNERLQSELDFWAKHLAGVPALIELPIDRPRPPLHGNRGARQPIGLPPSTVSAIRKTGQQEGATLFMVLMAALQALLHRYNQKDDIVVTTGVANRDRTQLESIVGFFADTRPLRADFSQRPTFRELLRQMRETTLEVFGHPDVPFEMLVEHLQLERDSSFAPLFQAMFVLQDVLAVPAAGTGLNAHGEVSHEMDMVAVDTGLTRVDFYLSLAETSEGGLDGVVEYNADLFFPATIDSMIRSYVNLLEHVVENPDTQVAAIPLVRREEGQRISSEFSELCSQAEA